MSINSNISSLSTSSLIGAAKTQLAGKKDLVKRTAVSKIDVLKNKLVSLNNKIKQTEKEYNDKFNQLQKNFTLGYVSEEEVKIKYEQFQKQLSEEIKLIQEEIQKVQQDILKGSKDVLKNIKDAKKKLNNRINRNIKQIDKNQTKANVSRNIQVLKNTAKDKIAPIVISLLTNLAISIIKRNYRLQELVDKTNEVIDAADTIPKINQARVLRNNALKIISDQEAKITRIRNVIRTIQRIIEILTIVITIIQLILKLPYPFLIPIKIKLQPILQRILKILSELSVGLAIITAVLNDLIDYLNDLKLQLHDLGTLIEAKTSDPTIDAEQFLQNIRSNSQQIANITTYKGFKFAIREESGPNAIVVRGLKRHYAVAIDTNNVDVLKSDLSFTQDPQDLIDTLKIIIDRENLIA